MFAAPAARCCLLLKGVWGCGGSVIACAGACLIAAGAAHTTHDKKAEGTGRAPPGGGARQRFRRRPVCGASALLKCLVWTQWCNSTPPHVLLWPGCLTLHRSKYHNCTSVPEVVKRSPFPARTPSHTCTFCSNKFISAASTTVLPSLLPSAPALAAEPQTAARAAQGWSSRPSCSGAGRWSPGTTAAYRGRYEAHWQAKDAGCVQEDLAVSCAALMGARNRHSYGATASSLP